MMEISKKEANALIVRGNCFSLWGKKIQEIDLSGEKIKEVILKEVTILNGLFLEDATLTNFILQNSIVKGAINIAGAKIFEDVSLWQSKISGDNEFNYADFAGIKIGGNFFCTKSRIPGLWMGGGEVRGSVFIRESQIKGFLGFPNAKVGYDLEVMYTTFSQLDLRSLKVGGKIVLSNVKGRIIY
jgi:uncharacterized protein YjbI with pentapeptide repeats